MKDKLKPCPFCGCTTIRDHQQYYREIEHKGKLYQLFCVSCGGTIRGLKTYALAVKAWNRRPK